MLNGMADRTGKLLERTRRFYAKIEAPFSSLSLIGGFVFDAVTLTRVDRFLENIWVVAHLLIVTVCALLVNLIENERNAESDPAKLHFWLVNVMQFFFGGIFSTFLVFYFRSGSIAADWPFLILLAAAFIANERFKRHYARLTFQISLLFLSYYGFAIYLLPIFFHTISTDVFLLSGAVSLAAISLLILALRNFSHERFSSRALWLTRALVLGIFAVVNFLYFANLIPPLPLSLKDAGVYQSFVVNGPGNYTAQREDQGPFSFFHWSDIIHITLGAPLYAYTAVFSPTSFNLNIVHVWQYYDPARGAWVTEGRVPLTVLGGGDLGYRTFSLMPSLVDGSWRVNVETPGGQIIGQIRFEVVTTSTLPALSTININ
jgi:hypothetical protein